MGVAKHRPSHATVVAYLALLVALGGSSYAAVQAGRNTVTSKSIKNGQVKKKDLATGAVSSAKVLDKSVGGTDLAPGAVVGIGGAGIGSFPTEPPATPGANTAQQAQTTLTTSEPSKLIVMGTASPGLTCTAAGSCGITMGLYVDAQPLQGSGGAVSAGPSGAAGRTLTLLGTSGTVPAGQHQVLLAGTFTNGSNVQTWGVGERRIAAIAVRP